MSGLYSAPRGAKPAEQAEQVRGNLARVVRGVPFGEKGFDPDKALQDMRVPKELLAELSQPFKNLGYSVEEREVRDRYNGKLRRSVTVVHGNGNVRYLLYVPKKVLDVASQENLAAVGYLESMFEDGTQLFVFARNLDVPARGFRRMLPEWERNGIRVTVVPWRDLEELEGDPEDDDLVAEIFGIEREPPSDLRMVASGPKDKAEDRPQIAVGAAGGDDGSTGFGLSDDERREILDFMATMANGHPKGSVVFFTEMVRLLELPPEWQKLGDAWTGDLMADARTLLDYVASLDEYPPSSQRPHGCKVLGVLIARLYGQRGNRQQRAVFRGIVVRYRLLPQEYFNEQMPE